MILDKFSDERKLFQNYIDNRNLIENELQAGEAKAREIGSVVLDKVRKAIGYR